MDHLLSRTQWVSRVPCASGPGLERLLVSQVRSTVPQFGPLSTHFFVVRVGLEMWALLVNMIWNGYKRILDEVSMLRAQVWSVCMLYG